MSLYTRKILIFSLAFYHVKRSEKIGIFQVYRDITILFWFQLKILSSYILSSYITFPPDFLSEF